MTDRELELLKEKIISYVVDRYNNGDTDFEECIILNEDDDNSPCADIDGNIYVDSYDEDDGRCGYMNGTGACVITSVDVVMNIKVYDGDYNPFNIDTREIEELIEKEITW